MILFNASIRFACSFEAVKTPSPRVGAPLQKERKLITMNDFTIVGRLDTVMPLDETASGIKVINFIVSVERPFKSNQAFDDFRVTAFKELAEAIASSKPVGSTILVKGRLQSNNYRKDDKVYYSPELLADKVLYIKR